MNNTDGCEWHHQDDDFLCHDCHRNTLDEYYMVHDSIWGESKVPTRALLCIGCLEKRIGRKLKPEDFTNAPVNDPGVFPMGRSVRLTERLGGSL